MKGRSWVRGQQYPLRVYPFPHLWQSLSCVDIRYGSPSPPSYDLGPHHHFHPNIRDKMVPPPHPSNMRIPTFILRQADGTLKNKLQPYGHILESTIFLMCGSSYHINLELTCDLGSAVWILAIALVHWSPSEGRDGRASVTSSHRVSIVTRHVLQRYSVTKQGNWCISHRIQTQVKWTLCSIHTYIHTYIPLSFHIREVPRSNDWGPVTLTPVFSSVSPSFKT
jgi:hypothetical protein